MFVVGLPMMKCFSGQSRLYTSVYLVKKKIRTVLGAGNTTCTSPGLLAHFLLRCACALAEKEPRKRETPARSPKMACRRPSQVWRTKRCRCITSRRQAMQGEPFEASEIAPRTPRQNLDDGIECVIHFRSISTHQNALFGGKRAFVNGDIRQWRNPF